MSEDVNTETMPESTKMIKVSDKAYERLQKFGFAGESINKALLRALAIAEKHKGEMGKE